MPDTFGATYGAMVLADAPVGYWRLDDTGSIADDQRGQYPGAYSGTVIQGIAGATDDGDGAVRFGARTLTTNMKVPDAPALRLAGSKTIELWLNPNNNTDQGTYANVVSKGNNLSGWLLYLNPPVFLAYRENTSFQVSWNTSPLIVDAWNHVVFTYDAATTQNRLYVNGAVFDAGLHDWGTNTDTNPLAIGTIRSLDQGTTSSIDELALYDHALTTAQVQAHFAAARAP